MTGITAYPKTIFSMLIPEVDEKLTTDLSHVTSIVLFGIEVRDTFGELYTKRFKRDLITSCVLFPLQRFISLKLLLEVKIVKSRNVMASCSLVFS